MQFTSLFQVRFALRTVDGEKRRTFIRCLGVVVCQETHEVKLNLRPWMSQKPRPLDMHQEWIKAQKDNWVFSWTKIHSELLWPFMSRVLKCYETKWCLFSFWRWWCQHCRIFFPPLKLLLFMWILFFLFAFSTILILYLALPWVCPPC